MPVRHLELAEYALIAEAIGDLPAGTVLRRAGLDLAEAAINAPAAARAGRPAYSTIEEQAAALCWQLLRNPPLPAGNQQVAFIATLEFLERNGRSWQPADDDPGETDRILRSVSAGELGRSELHEWIVRRLA